MASGTDFDGDNLMFEMEDCHIHTDTTLEPSPHSFTEESIYDHSIAAANNTVLPQTIRSICINRCLDTAQSTGKGDREMVTQGFRNFAHSSNDLVLAAHFNEYGTRLVTGSADHRIRVFDMNQENWQLTDLWRGHNAQVLDVKWNGPKMGQILGSIGDDLKLKIWQEDPTEAHHSGRRFKCVFSQSSGHSVVYTSLDFVNPNKDTYLAIVTRDGLLSLLEPVNSEKFDDWREIDQILVCDAHIARGVETCFKLCFQQSTHPNSTAIAAGLDKSALSIAVTALTEVRVYRVIKMTGHGGQELYKFQDRVAVLGGADGLVRGVAWSAEAWRPQDWIATAAADGYIRIYEISTPKQNTVQTASPAVPPKTTLSNAGEGPSKAGVRAPSGIGAGLDRASLAASLSSLSIGQIRHEAKCVEQIKHEGVWEVQWMSNSHILISSGDSGQARMWRQAHDGKWHEFAEFGPE
ncbi:epoxide hydrolase, soluble (sEH) [Xylographa opegraphella]|nr:epoxide hydrolase, soluble (sEH) [Xylographa opegraphella]